MFEISAVDFIKQFIVNFRSSLSHLRTIQNQSSYAVMPANVGQSDVHIGGSNNKLNVMERVNYNYPSNSLENSKTECNYKNCTVNKPICCNLSSTSTPQFESRDVRDAYTGQYQQDSNRESNNDQKLATILPPPLFDESVRLCNNVCDQIRTPLSRRQHRTIPRHFTTASEPLSMGTLHKSNRNSNDTPKKSSATVNKNKKLICQCPVQHVPMGSKQVNTSRDQQSEVFLSTLSTKLNNQKQNYVAKAKSIHATSKEGTY